MDVHGLCSITVQQNFVSVKISQPTMLGHIRMSSARMVPPDRTRPVPQRPSLLPAVGTWPGRDQRSAGHVLGAPAGPTPLPLLILFQPLGCCAPSLCDFGTGGSTYSRSTLAPGLLYLQLLILISNWRTGRTVLQCDNRAGKAFLSSSGVTNVKQETN